MEHTRAALLRWLAAAAVVLALTGLWYRQSQREAADVRGLPQPERAALYVHTMETLRGVCAGEHRAALDEYCTEQAELVMRLPECDDECQTFVRMSYRKPTR